MEDGVDPRHDVVGEVDRLGLGISGDDADVFEIAGEKLVRISVKALPPEPFFEFFRLEPHPIQEFIGVYECYYSNTRNCRPANESIHDFSFQWKRREACMACYIEDESCN